MLLNYLSHSRVQSNFYKLSKVFDESDTESIYKDIHTVIYKIFRKTELNRWFNEDRVINKRSEDDKNTIAPIKTTLDILNQNVSFGLVAKVLKQIKQLPSVMCYRKELFLNLCKALEQAEYENVSVYEAMKSIRNTKRRVGRKLYGKCIGTTLLTKGLEFDTVALLDAHKFDCPKNLYVALTRASKRLVVFTKDKILSPYTE